MVNIISTETVGQIPVRFCVGDDVEVLHAVSLPKREVVIGRGIVERITYQSSDNTPLYWISGLLCARTARVLRLVKRAR